MSTLKKQHELIPCKKCYECGDRKPLEHYAIRIKKDGTEGFEGRCISCLNKVKNRKKATEKLSEETNTGMRFCKICGKDKKLELFPEKGKNGSRYVDCGTCRSKKKAK